MENFKFQIGDMVLVRVGIESSIMNARVGNPTSPKVGMIVERLMQECPGGIQKHYKIPPICDAAYMEIELISLSEWKESESFKEWELACKDSRKSREWNLGDIFKEKVK